MVLRGDYDCRRKHFTGYGRVAHSLVRLGDIMAWKAILDSINENQGPADEVGINVRFEETGGKTFVRWYKVTSGSASSLADLKGIVLGELQKLNGFDNVVDTLKTLIGKEIK